MSVSWFKKRGNCAYFFNGLNYNTRLTIEIATSGALMNKSVEDALGLIEDMILNQFQWANKRCAPSKQAGKYDIDVLQSLIVKVNSLTQTIDSLNMHLVMSNSVTCVIYGCVRHYSNQC